MLTPVLKGVLKDARVAAYRYLRVLPAVVPAGRVLVHNHIRPGRRLGARGFRAWLLPSDLARLEVCGCAWAPQLGQHFRVKARRRKPAKNPAEEAAALAAWRQEVAEQKRSAVCAAPVLSEAVARALVRVGIHGRAAAALFGPP